MRDPHRSLYTATLSAAHRLALYKLASACRARCTPATAVFPHGPCGGRSTCSGCRHPELPTRSRAMQVGSWGVVFSVKGATLDSLLGNHLPIHLIVINYKIFGKSFESVLARAYDSYSTMSLYHDFDNLFDGAYLELIGDIFSSKISATFYKFMGHMRGGLC